jgi:signal transduction histidine kinase
VAAIAAPLGAWYVAGSRGAQREAERIAGAPREAALRTAERLADRLSQRLEALRIVESRRPIEHYEPGHEAEAGSCGCATDATPLARGLSDPLARAYFQIDGLGRLTLPGWPPTDGTRTVGQAPGGPLDAEWTTVQRAVFEELECAATSSPPTVQHDEAKPAARAAVAEAASPRSPTPDAGDVIMVGPLEWRSMQIGGRPTLAALRKVNRPDAILTQGFVVSTEAVERSLSGVEYPAHFRPDPPADAAVPTVGIEGTGWHVAVDAGEAVARAAVVASGVERRFRRSFMVGTAVTVFAGLCVVGLVWQTERIARQRSRFAASAAHELRTPLAGMKLYGEMLAEDLGHAERRRDYSRRIADEADRLGRVVGNVLGYSGLERGSLGVRAVPGDLAASVHECIERLRPAIEKQGARIEIASEAELPTVCFDRDAVAQILHNLLDNAEKYSRGCDDRTIDVRVERAGSAVRVAVHDRGRGVPAPLRRRLFRPFTRAGETEAAAGLGLGLALVHALASEQHARVTHAERPGGGSVFSVLFSG